MLRLKTIIVTLIFFWISALLATPSWAGGPRLISTPRWNPEQPIQFVFDPGPLRGGVQPLTNAQGMQIVLESFAAWTDLPTTSLVVESVGSLPADVTTANINATLTPGNPPASPIVFDADGSITNMLLGMGSSSSVLGFANAFDSTGDGFQNFGFAVLNGLRSSLTSPAFRVTATHELGHLIGLDHTQSGLSFFNRCSAFDNTTCAFVPIMFPIIASSAPNLNSAPILDDQVWLSWLYPSAEFNARGTLRGKVNRRSGIPFQGANVVAAQAVPNGAQGFTEHPVNRVSVVSDFLARADGSFFLPGLPAGDYVVFVEALDPRFTAGSGVGPFETRFTNFNAPDYFNGSSESGDDSTDDIAERERITVAAGQTVAGINLITNDRSDDDPLGDLATIGDDDSRTIFFAQGFTFPFFGTAYGGVFVNSDGNLTFLQPDSSSLSRGESRFVTGVPRIGPLFSDLDPSVGGSISMESTANSLTFRWQDVPEFGGTLPNNFAVTLFANGDILFDYQDISVTSDQDGIQAIVGIAPGNEFLSNRMDLSSLSQPIQFSSDAVYEFFTGAFDLANQQIRYQASTNQFFLYVPLYRGNATDFTGVAITNDADVDANLTIEALDGGGLRQPYPQNPGFETLGSKKQLARLGAEFFDLGIREEQDGWIRISSDRQELASFYQFGNGLTGEISQLDGSVAFTGQSNVLYFTRLYQGPAAFPTLNGGIAATTTLALANPNATPVTLTLRLFSPNGSQIGLEVVRQLAANACLRETLSSLFGSQQITDGFVRVDVTGAGAVGFELIELPDTLLGFNAVFGNAANTSYSAQLANGGVQPIFTSVKTVNVASVPRSVTLTALTESGAVAGIVGPFTLQPNQTFQRDAGMIFGLGPSTGTIFNGSLRVDADGPGVIGDVVFGNPNTGRYAAALPLQSELFTRAIFGQVTNSIRANAALSLFTGLAFHNPNVSDAQVTIRVFTQDCVLTGETTITLGAGERISELLADLIPASAGQVRGYIEVTSTQPLVAQELFGNFTLSFLSAVPPTIF